MFQANQVTQPLHGQPGQQKIPEFPGAVQCGRVIDNVVVDVFPVGMSSDDKSIFTFGEPHCQFVAHLVGFFGGNFPGPKGLANLVGNHIIFLLAASYKLILPFGQHEFLIYCQGTALVAADQLAVFRFVRVLRIIRAAFQTGRNGLAFIFVQRNQSCCGHLESPTKEKCRPEAAENFGFQTTSQIHSLNRWMPSVMAVAPKKRTKQANSATSKITN